jgi:hypothetical protein
LAIALPLYAKLIFLNSTLPTPLITTSTAGFSINHLIHHQQMAESVLFDTAATIIKNSASLALQEIGLLCDFKDELKKLGKTVSTIQAVLLDAEEQQAHNRAVKDWLGKLKDVMYEADDLLDDYSTELLRRLVMAGDNKAKQVNS